MSSVIALVGLFAGSVAATKPGDIVVITKPTELQPEKGVTVSLTPGTCLMVLAVDERGLLGAAGFVGRVDSAHVIPLAEATDLFTKRIEDDKADATAWLARGKVAFHKNELDKAIADLDASLKLVATSEAHAIRGFAWKRKGDKDKAMADFDEAIKLNPKEALAWRVRGATWAAKGEYAKTLADYHPRIYRPFTVIRFGRTASAFGTRTVSTPFARDASILSLSTFSAMVNARWKSPTPYSTWIAFVPWARGPQRACKINSLPLRSSDTSLGFTPGRLA